MKRLMIICDGMADEPLPQLGGKTPYEYADTENMDALAASCSTGHLCNCPLAFPAGSDTAILTLFGYDLHKVYSGRAPLEAANAGIILKEEQYTARVSFLRLDNGVIRGVVFDAPAEKLLEDPRIAAMPGITLHVQKNGQPLAVLDRDPGQLVQPHGHVGEHIASLMPADPGLREMIRLSTEILGQQLCIWFWGSGKAGILPPFPVDASLISATPLCRGIGILAGMEVLTVPGATGDLNTDYAGKARAAIEAMDRGKALVTVHIEAPDECSHLFDVPGKVESIRRIDKLLLPPLLDYLQHCGEAYRVLILSDHPTSSRTGSHTYDPVPYVIFDSEGKSITGTSAMELLFAE